MRRYVSLAVIAVTVYIGFLFFVGDYSVIKSFEYQRTIDSLQVTLTQTTDSVNHYHQLNRRLESDPEAVERVIREEHNMTAPGEEVYIAIPDSK